MRVRSKADVCPCGATVLVDSVTPDFMWRARCDVGHRVYLTDLLSRPVILEGA